MAALGEGGGGSVGKVPFEEQLAALDGTRAFFPERAFDFEGYSDEVDTVVIEQDPGLTGGTVWDAETVLSHYLVETFGRKGLAGKRIIELGAGTGLAGIVAARLGADVVFTELDAVLPVLTRNVQRSLPANDSAACCSLSWGSDLTAIPTVQDKVPFDLILVADCIYTPELYAPLLATIEACSGPGTEVLISFEQRRKDITPFFTQFDSSSIRPSERRWVSSPISERGKDLARSHICSVVFSPGASAHELQMGKKVGPSSGSSGGASLASQASQSGCPTYCILGAQKAGTTSVYEYLCQHPLVIRGVRRETHFFDWRWDSGASTSEAQLASYRKFFDQARLQADPSLVTGDSTPSYLLSSDLVIPRMQAVAPWLRLVICLREPIARAYSHYQMTVDKKGTAAQKETRGRSEWVNMSFEEVVAAELAELEAMGITAETSAEEFRQVYLSTRPMGHGGHSLLARGFYALQLEPWLSAFTKDQVMLVSMGDLHSPASTQRVMNDIYRHVGLAPHELQDTGAKNTRDYPPLDLGSAVAQQLQAFFRPHNTRLMRLLGPATPLHWLQDQELTDVDHAGAGPDDAAAAENPCPVIFAGIAPA